MKSSWALPEGQCPLQRCAAFSAADALWVQLPTKYPYVHAQLLISCIWSLLQKPSQGGQSSKPLMIIKNKWFTYYQYSWDYKTINQIKLFRTSNPDLAYFSHFLPRFTKLCAYSKLLKEVKHPTLLKREGNFLQSLMSGQILIHYHLFHGSQCSFLTHFRKLPCS